MKKKGFTVFSGGVHLNSMWDLFEETTSTLGGVVGTAQRKIRWNFVCM